MRYSTCSALRMDAMGAVADGMTLPLSEPLGRGVSASRALQGTRPIQWFAAAGSCKPPELDELEGAKLEPVEADIVTSTSPQDHGAETVTQRHPLSKLLSSNNLVNCVSVI